MSEMKRELSLEEMDKVSGGSAKTIRPGGAIVRNGAGSSYPQVGRVDGGSVVNFTGTVSYNDQDGHSWYMISSPLRGWIRKYDIE